MRSFYASGLWLDARRAILVWENIIQSVEPTWSRIVFASRINSTYRTRYSDYGRNKDYLSHGRRGDAVSGEAQHIAGKSDPSWFQKRLKSAKLQIFLQVNGRWLWVNVNDVLTFHYRVILSVLYSILYVMHHIYLYYRFVDYIVRFYFAGYNVNIILTQQIIVTLKLICF